MVYRSMAIQEERLRRAQLQAESEKRERERAKYRRYHPERFFYIAILKHNEDDRYCNDPVVLVGRTEEAVNKQLAEFIEVDEVDHESDEGDLEDSFDDSVSCPWQVIYSSWDEIDA